MRTKAWATIHITVFLSLISATSHGGDVPADSPHPRLFFSAADLPRMAARLGSGKIGKVAGDAITYGIKGQRHDASIAALIDTSGDPSNRAETDKPSLKNDPYAAILIYDFQYPYMTDSERKAGKARILADAKYLADRAVARDYWYWNDTNTNNWIVWALPNRTYHYLQRILLPALLFPDAMETPLLLREGLRLFEGLLSLVDGDVLTDETTNAVNGYGMGVPYFMGYMLMAMHQNKEVIGFDCFEYKQRQVYHDGRFRLYLYQTVDDFKGTDMYGPQKGTGGFEAYSVPLGGHGSCGPPGNWLRTTILPHAGHYRSPELSWLYLQQRGWSDWNTDANYYDLRDFIYRGAATPRSPAATGWPLQAHFPTIGVYIMRQSWQGDGSVVACRNGLVGSHGQPSQGQVVFTGSGYAVLGHVQKKLQSYNTEPYGVFYRDDPRTNSILFVDGKSQGKNRHTVGGTLQVLGPDMVEMDPSDAYAAVGIDVQWKRMVAYRRDLDLLLIEDTVSGGDKELMFNWVTEGRVISDTLYDMPGPYFMAARVVGSNTPVSAENVMAPGPDVFPQLQVTVPAGSIKVRWAIGPGRELAKTAVDEWPLPSTSNGADAAMGGDEAGPAVDAAPSFDAGPDVAVSADSGATSDSEGPEEDSLVIAVGGCGVATGSREAAASALPCWALGLVLFWRRRRMRTAHRREKSGQRYGSPRIGAWHALFGSRFSRRRRRLLGCAESASSAGQPASAR